MQATTIPASVCQCSDPGCPEHRGSACQAVATVPLLRIDMSGARVDMCDACACDALDSGVFASDESERAS